MLIYETAAITFISAVFSTTTSLSNQFVTAAPIVSCMQQVQFIK